MDKRRLLFLDESALRLSAAPNDTLMVDDDDGIIETTDTSAYAARYDMIAVCSAERVLLPKIFTPKERADAEVKGINGAMLLQYIEDLLAQAVEGLDRFPLSPSSSTEHPFTRTRGKSWKPFTTAAHRPSPKFSCFLPTLPSACLPSTTRCSTTGSKNAASAAPLRERTSSRS